ncbi:hypothetical protein JG688_00015228, partial [Phytophthora aleatoria]
HSRGQRDVARREKRIPSRGEPKRITSSHGGSRKETKAQTDQIKRAAVATSMREFFSSEIRAAEKKKRAKYTCSQCGKAESHNAVKCPNRKSGNVESDVEPGDYIVGNCPLEIAGTEDFLCSSRDCTYETEVQLRNVCPALPSV